MNSLLEPARDISEEKMRSLLARKRECRAAYESCIANKHIWAGMDSSYEQRRAMLWFDLVEASNAVTEAGL